MSRISHDIQTLGEWIKRETKISNVVYNNDPISNSDTISARIVFVNYVKGESAKINFMDLNILLRIMAPATSWRDCLNTMQDIISNLLEEREHDYRFGDVENPLGTDAKEGDFMLDIPITLISHAGDSA